MTKATEPHTTTPPEPIPTVYDIGRHLVTLWATLDQHDQRITDAKTKTPEYFSADADYKATSTEIDAMEALIFTRPVDTLADAAALASVGFRIMDHLTAIDARTTEITDELVRLRAAFARLTFRLSDAAAVPFAVIAGGNDLDYISRYASTGEARP